MRKTGNYYLGSFIPNPLPPTSPPLELNTSIISLYGEASFALGQLNEASLRLPDPKRFINAYVIKESMLSSEIEGIHTTLIDVLADAVSNTRANKETQLVLNYIKSLEVAKNMIKNEGLPIVTRVILAAHKALMAGEGDKSSPGLYRMQSVKVGELTPPTTSEIARLTSDLEKYINEDTSLPPLIKAGLAHVQFEIIHPFLDGNGRIGRLLIVLILISNQLLNEPIIYPSYYFKKNSAEYYLRLDQVRTSGNFEEWITFYLTAIRDSSIEACNRIKVIEAQEVEVKTTIMHKQQFSKIRDTSYLILNSLYQTPVFNIKQISLATGLAYNTVHSIINHFIELGWTNELNNQKRNKMYRFSIYLELLEKEL